MANYIAELMHDAEQASPPERMRLRKECSETILRLWEHRDAWHSAAPANAIKRLLEKNSRLFDHTQVSNESKVITSWLDLLREVDEDMKNVSLMCICAQIASIPREEIEADIRWLSDEPNSLSDEERKTIEWLRDRFEYIYSTKCILAPNYGYNGPQNSDSGLR